MIDYQANFMRSWIIILKSKKRKEKKGTKKGEVTMIRRTWGSIFGGVMYCRATKQDRFHRISNGQGECLGSTWAVVRWHVRREKMRVECHLSDAVRWRLMCCQLSWSSYLSW